MLKHKINDYFKLPIFFSDNVYTIPQSILDELELVNNKTSDPSNSDISNNTLYNTLLNTKNDFSKLVLEQWSTSYTTDINYLTDTQKLLTHVSNNEIDTFKTNDTAIKSWESFTNIKEDENFVDKYQYINWDQLKFLNYSVLFLSVFSIYSILSPALNVIAPFFLLLIPFLILKVKKIPITFQKYMGILMVSLKNNTFGRLITQWSSIPWNQRIYMIVMMGMYVYNIYQNMLSCYAFYKNTATINKNIQNINNFTKETIHKIKNYQSIIQNYNSYKPYNDYLNEKVSELEILQTSLDKIPKASFSIKKIPYLGFTLKQYFTIYDSLKIENLMLFSFGFDSYLDKLISLSKLIKNKTINKTSFSQSLTPVVKFSKIYSPNINCNNIIKNTFNLSKNKLITGPNASGKTTLLKTTLSNIIISQQIGFGFYNKAILTPFDTFHCYINIPDTSSRDSLFQAEARQCLNIINNISENTDKKHFCIFDELFSGTNPFEAVSSAQSYLDYISNFKHVKFMLTTHFIKLCNNLKSNKSISNINMETVIHNNVPTYKYKIKKGISDAKGGISVLKQLNYPDKIVTNTINNLKTI